MDKEHVFKLAEIIVSEPQLGIASEINDFLEREEAVLSHKLSIDGKYYILSVKLKKFSSSEVKRIFLGLVRFIEYTSTFYVREDHEEKIEYVLLSSTKNKLAFLVSVTFLQD